MLGHIEEQNSLNRLRQTLIDNLQQLQTNLRCQVHAVLHTLFCPTKIRVSQTLM